MHREVGAISLALPGHGKPEQAVRVGIEPQVDFEWLPGVYGAADHDQQIVEHCVMFAQRYEAIALGQFSMAGAAPAAREACPVPVWDTPSTAVDKLRAVWMAGARLG